ncbi:rhodanese-like domain-containing protein [Microbacterium sp.]|uniref:rhodanese-like domain-containing protein n=1 Tax=unclassified Microbacterium TaxID=2609290 RepID=UPI00260A8699|nr:rhodanese-like domain-containing protein [Microbacterium sp.]
MRRIRLAVAALAAVVLATSLAACSATPSVEVPEGAVIIDVRTPDEYAEGHLEGAINVNLQSGSFEQEIAEQPLDGTYIVYCRTGNRSAQAVAIMTDLGFTDVTDAGGVSDASAATGIPIVTD